MNAVGQREIQTQRRVVAFFRDTLDYAWLGDWQDRIGNSNIERDLVAKWLRRRGHGVPVIAKVLDRLTKAAALGGSATLYHVNREFHGLLRYGVKVQPELG